MNKTRNIFVKAVSGIILFIIYIFIAYIADNYYLPYGLDEKVFCILLAVIITPIWYFLSVKILKSDYEKVSDYLPLEASFCAVYFVIYAIDSSVVSDIFIYLLELYVIGNCIIFSVSYLIHAGKERRRMLIKRVGSTAILYFIYNLIFIGGIFTGTIIFAPVAAVIITVIFYSKSTQCFGISYDMGGVKTTIAILLIINLTFWCLAAVGDWYIILGVLSSFIYAFLNFVAFDIFCIRRSKRMKMQSDEVCTQDTEEKKDNSEKNELSYSPKPHKQHDLRNVVLENMKRFLLEPGKDFILVDEEYHLNAGKEVYHPDLLLYHMKLKCHVAVDLRIDDFKPEYSSRMDTYLETLDRNVKKTDDNPSAGLILCKNADTNVAEYSLNKDLSQEMAAEYEAKLIDKKTLKKKLNELYDRAKEANPDSDT